MNAQDLKNSILQLAVQGKLVEQRAEEGTARELLEQIKAEKEQLIKDKKIKKSKPLPEITEDEIPFEIPESWEWVRVGEVFSLQAGKNISSSKIFEELSEEHKYPCYGGNGLRGYVNLSNRFGKHALIGRQGALCGNINVAQDEFYATEHAVVVDTFGYTSTDWTAYFLKALNLNQYATATAQPGLAVSNIVKVLIPLPPLEEQKRIVTKIEEILPYIDQYDKAYTKLEIFNKKFPEDMKKSILQMAMQGKLVEQRPEEGTAEELYEQIVVEKIQLIKDGKIKKEKPLPEITEDEIPFEIPSSWKWVRFSEVMDVRDGTHDSPEYIDIGIPLVTSKNISGGRLDFSNVKYISREDANKINERSNVDSGDILFAMIGSIGNPVIVNKDREFCVKNVALFKNYNKSKICIEYVYWFLYREQYIMKKNASGGVQSFISLKVFRNYLFPLPPLEEQKRIVAKLEEVLPYCEQLINVGR